MERERQYQERRDSIVQAAMACFVARGFHATSMRDVAQAAGVSLGNLYNYFSGKDALIAEVATQEQHELQPLVDRLHTAAPTRALIEATLAAYWSLCSDPAWGMLSAECLLETARRPALTGKVDANRRRLVAALAAAIDRGIAGGAFAPGAPAPVVAQVLLDAVESDALRVALAPARPDADRPAHCGILHPALLTSLLPPCAAD